MAGEAGHRDAGHRTGESVGERLLRKLQRKTAGRMLKRRDLLLVEGGADRDRKMAGGVQHAAATLVVGLQAAGAGGL